MGGLGEEAGGEGRAGRSGEVHKKRGWEREWELWKTMKKGRKERHKGKEC